LLDYALLFIGVKGVRVEAGDCGGEPGQKGYPDGDKLENITIKYKKHIAPNNLNEKGIIGATENSASLYFGSPSKIVELETTGLKKGVFINDDTMVYDAGFPIGASEGKTTSYIRCKKFSTVYILN